MKRRVLAHPRRDPDLAARAELEQSKLLAQADLAVADLEGDGSAALYLARKLQRLGRRVRIDPFTRRDDR